jgi:hypothetical protein
MDLADLLAAAAVVAEVLAGRFLIRVQGQLPLSIVQFREI